MPVRLLSRRARLWAQALIVVSAYLASGTPSRADEEACIAASEKELESRKAGRLQEAQNELALCTDPSCSEVARTVCAKRAVELRAAIPTLVLRATDAAGNDLTDVGVTLDGVPFASRLDGRPISADPGSRTLHFEAPGKLPVDKSIVIAEGEKDRPITVVMATVIAATGVVAHATGPAQTTRGGGARTAGFVLGGFGAAGLVVASALGGLAIAKANDAKGLCGSSSSPECPTSSATAAANAEGHTSEGFAEASTVMFIAGGALLGSAIVMMVIGARGTHEKRTFQIAPSLYARGGLSFQGVW
jgi:hypothetical protein